ncbi:MAG: hypothetical protein ACRD50_16805 [Candidatus Acidiferrales bacterium]
MEILRQLGELFLEALPTVIIVFLFFLFLKFSFFRPLERAMEERHRRIEGARAEAANDAAATKEIEAAYREALRKARGEIYAEQEAALKIVLDERAKRTREKRAQAQEGIRAAKERIARELEAASARLETDAAALAGEITRRILERRLPAT